MNNRSKLKPKNELVVGITRKGSLANRVHHLNHRANYLPEDALDTRKFEIQSLQEGIRFRFLSTKSMPQDVINGRVDIGFSGADIIANHNLDQEEGVTVMADFPFSRKSDKPARLVMATVPELTGIETLNQCRGKRIATEFGPLTRRELQQQFGFTNADCKGIYSSSGATEGEIFTLDADAVSDISETGETFQQNKMVELGLLFESVPQLICNNIEMWHHRNLRDMAERYACDLLNVLTVEKAPLKMIKANIRAERLEEALMVLPALQHPDYTPLGNPQYSHVSGEENYYSVTTVIPQSQLTRVISQLEGALGKDVNNILSFDVKGLHSRDEARKKLYPPKNGKK